MENKIDTPKEDYYKIDRMSNSMMKHFDRSPRHFLYERRYPSPPTPAMIFGNLFHTFVLEPDLFEERYMSIPNGAPKRPTKAQIYAENPSDKTIESIEWWDRFEKENAGKTVVDIFDLERVKRMNDALRSNKMAEELLMSITETEKEMFWTDDITGIEMKGKLDGCNDDMTLDLKSCENAKPQIFAYQAYQMGYDRQGALYMDARGQLKMKKGEFFFIAVEKEEPFGVSVNKASKDFIEQGRYRYGKILENYAYWKQMGSPEIDYEWGVNPFGYHELHLPPWAR